MTTATLDNGSAAAPVIRGDIDESNPPNQKATLMFVTPEIAEAWLRHNQNFRKRKDHHVRNLKRRVRATGWQCDGSPIRFDAHGNMVDGQHRAEVIAALGVGCWAWVISGVTEEETLAADTGLPRTLSDQLAYLETPNAKLVAAAIGYLWRIERAAWDGYLDKPSISEGMAVFGRHPALVESASMFSGSGLSRRWGRPILAAIHCWVGREDRAAADMFANAVATGVGLGHDDPVRRLRDKMVVEQGAKRQITMRERIALVTLAWNYWIQGRECRRLAWRATGPTAQRFPQIVMPSQVARDEDAGVSTVSAATC